MLSDRRLCLALDEPQICNGHVGVRAGPEPSCVCHPVGGPSDAEERRAQRARGIPEAAGGGGSVGSRALRMGLWYMPSPSVPDRVPPGVLRVGHGRISAPSCSVRNWSHW